MGRWQPDARGRLIRAALELYEERGFEQTSAAEIAQRAGVTERTFFRHFADKREVLFDGSTDLQAAVVGAIAAAPSPTAPIDVVGAAMQGAASFFEDRRDHARRRAAVIAANPGLQERELLKLSRLASASAEALGRRGVAEPAATLAAETGVTVFKVAFDRWVADGATGDYAACVRDALAQLRALTAGS